MEPYFSKLISTKIVPIKSHDQLETALEDN